MATMSVNKPNGEDPFPVGRIRVWPRTENIRKYIKHPLGNIAFRGSLEESVEWPFDQFTKRRLADGTVLDHAPISEPPSEPGLPGF